MTEGMDRSHPTKKRKPTYLRRKEEADALHDQVLKLQHQLKLLESATESNGAQSRDLHTAVLENADLKEELGQQQRTVSAAQTVVREWLQNQATNPVAMRIHLGRDPIQRRETLLAMKHERLTRGYQHVTARFHHLDVLKPHFSEERFEDVNGDFCSIRNEVVPFPGIQSMRRAYDAFKFVLETLEIAISEHLGHLTIREDYDAVGDDAFISNYRLSSEVDNVITTELNAVNFGQYFEGGGDSARQPYAVMSIDNVDEDDLHPFDPKKSVRKVINGSIVLIPVSRRKKTKMIDGVGARGEDEVVIVMLRSVFVKTCRPQFDVSDAILQELCDNVTRWGDIAVQAVRRIIYTQ
ncbi:uncharacterized protein IUM83_06536 [Phytophthora cinnamomi]|uniref:uncharacterized protein n=1 Tax=Phytophthora cinnamomi TaxID=4785 RepID=UPI0035597AD7|nr:hypothetical protein IUM83_06536 [Phytophthora cinnamomi]